MNIDLARIPTNRVVSILNQAKLAQEKLEYEGSLSDFLKAAWPSIESSEYLDNWAIDAMAEHLEAVTYGQIRRLLINISPRCGKTNITSICWPAWVWAQRNKTYLSGPQVRFMCGSYNDKLTLTNSNKVRRLILSPFYQKYWGDRFELTEDQNTKSKFDTTKGGGMIATSVRGTLLGVGGDVIVCFPYHEKIYTEFGPMCIGDVVENKKKFNVWSYNINDNSYELKPITGWHKNPGRRLVRVTLSNESTFECTVDHRVLTTNGYVPSSLLVAGDVLHSLPSWMLVPSSNEGFSPGKIKMFPPSPLSYPIYSASTNSEIMSQYRRTFLLSFEDLFYYFFSQMGRPIIERPMFFTVRDILCPSPVFQVIESGIRPVSVSMSNLLAHWARTDKRSHDHLMAEFIKSFSIYSHCDPRVSFIRDWCENFLWQGISSIHSNPRATFNISETRNFISRCIYDWQPSFVKCVDIVHDIPPNTYCVSVEDNHNMLIGRGVSSMVVSNCDDPHNTEDVESEMERATAERWWKELSSTRMNNPKLSPIVVNMQRLHTKDISGLILDSDEEFVHLMIPMRYDERRKCVTVVLPRDQVDEFGNEIPKEDQVVWEDPRTVPGELMWPERFDEKEVKRIETRLGPMMASGRLQQTPTPAGGAILKRDWWQEWGKDEAAKYGLVWDENKGGIKEFPDFEIKIASLDTAFSEKEENDYSALTVWGIWSDKNHNPRAMLVYAWQRRLPLHGTEVSKRFGEAMVNFEQRRRSSQGLVEAVAEVCKKYKVNRLLIENKSRGLDVANEIRRLYSRENWGLQLINPIRDKVTRAHSIVPVFADGVVWAPDLSWADEVITQCELFPKDDHDDLVDTVTMAIGWLRDNGIIVRGDEVEASIEEEMAYRPQARTVAEMYNV